MTDHSWSNGSCSRCQMPMCASTTECPGRVVSEDEQRQIRAAKLNYRQGRWVPVIRLFGDSAENLNGRGKAPEIRGLTSTDLVLVAGVLQSTAQSLTERGLSPLYVQNLLRISALLQQALVEVDNCAGAKVAAEAEHHRDL